MWKFQHKTIITLLFAMLLVSLVWTLSCCSRTAKSLTEVHDTVFVSKHETDTLIRNVAHADTVCVLRTDTVYTVSAVRDSVLVRDSVFVRDKGDTVLIYKERWRERLAVSHDTIYKVKNDTVLITHTDTVRVLKYVERADTSSRSRSDTNRVVKKKISLTSFVLVVGACFLVFSVAMWRIRR